MKFSDIFKGMFTKPEEKCPVDPTFEPLEPAVPRPDDLSTRTLVEIIEHEGVVLEAYLDSKNIWTWGVGVTSMSGHSVERYIDNPQTMQRVLDVYEWLLINKYLPGVKRAFNGVTLKEHELAAALSFHWNTGAIERASWVRLYKLGEIEKAKESFMQWRSPPEIISRRKAERDLFFGGRWTSDGKVPVYDVRKPSYKPGGVKLMDIAHLL